MPGGSISISGSNSRLMRFPRTSALLLLFFLRGSLLSVQSQEPAPQESQPIRLRVDRVNVGVIVTDARGRFVEGLPRGTFHVFDNGTEQPITEFASIEDPGQVLLLVEVGPAVYLLESTHLHAALALLNGLSADDRVAIASYAEAPQPILDFTADKRTAAAALDQLRFNLGFAQLNLSSSLSTVLDWLAQVPGKKTIVLLSTGVDTSPPSKNAALLSRLKTTDVRILGVSLSGSLRSVKPAGKSKVADAATGFAEADQQLKALAEATGGRAYFPRNAKEFNGVYTEIAQLIRHEYSLAFTPPAYDAMVHAIEVRVTPDGPASKSPAPAYRVDHRQAYLAPRPNMN
jgi:Ca-activated chloride channel family protein